MPKVKMYKSYIGQIQSPRQLIRHRNLMLGLPLIRLSIAQIPLGYEVDPDNDKMLRPIDRELRLLYKARTLQHQYSLAALAEWLSKEMGKQVSWKTLRYIFKYRPPLNAYRLPLEQRLLIATAPDEEAAIFLCSQRRKDTDGSREAYIKSRAEAVRRKEEAKRCASSTEQSSL